MSDLTIGEGSGQSATGVGSNAGSNNSEMLGKFHKTERQRDVLENGTKQTLSVKTVRENTISETAKALLYGENSRY